MGGGQGTSGDPNTHAGAMGFYDPTFNYGAGPSATTKAFQQIGAGIQKAGAAYAQDVGGAQMNQQLYRPGSGSPYVGSQSASADEPSAYEIKTPPLPVSDFQKNYYNLVNQIYQSYQQRILNEGLGSGGFNM